jgi:hypothetical protein
MGGHSVPRLNRALRDVNLAIDHLKVRESPITEQFRPVFIPMVTPNPKQGDPVIDLGVFPEPAAGLPASPSLEASEYSDFTVRCVPKLPSNDASTMPHCILVWPRAPQIPVPTELVNRLPADAFAYGFKVVSC